MKRIFLSAFAATLILGMGVAQNPYMPLWEHIPDGEPYVFEDPDNAGQYRVYVYGSHDLLEWEYCGMDQVVWSAPVTNLTDWRCDRVIFESKNDRDGQHMNGNPMGDLLFAPDVAVKTLPNGQKEYYFYPNNQAKGRETMVAKSLRPDGPFTVCNWSKQNPARTEGCLGFDPAVFVDDDGRVYGYWGFQRHYAAELDPNTMASVKPGTEIIEDMVSNLHQPGDFRFFEASSIRKIEDKYVFIYSRWSAEGEWGLPGTCYTLAYAYSDYPLGPWTYGGTIIDGRGRDKDEKGNTIYTAYCTGNTHGSLCQINGQWWVFYHRHTGTDVYSRQAMVAPVSVTVEPGLGGKVMISEAEHTSEGFQIQGLDPLQTTQAGWACYLTGPNGMTQDYPNYSFSGPYILANRRGNEPGNPIVHNTSGSVVGYKYFNFDKTKDCTAVSLRATMRPQGINGYVDIYLDAPTSTKGGKKLGTIFIPREDELVPKSYSTPLHGLLGVEGKHALYFVFNAEIKEQSIATLYHFQMEDLSVQTETINH